MSEDESLIFLFHFHDVGLKEDHKNMEAVEVTVGPGHVAVNTIKLLIAGSQAGSLIGLSGQNVDKLRITSGATITIFAQNQLPLCASACESDRIVQVCFFNHFVCITNAKLISYISRDISKIR